MKSGASIDFETRASYKVVVQVSDRKDAAGDADSVIDDTVILTISVSRMWMRTGR